MSKRYNQAMDKVNRDKEYSVREGLELAKETATANFDETIELSVKLGIDPGQNDQQVRDTYVLPNGTGQEVTVIAFAQGEKVKEAEAAGADVVGGEELAEKIQNGWMDFDAVVATPDMMSVVGKLGPILGPQGMMPNPKLGTVTFDLEDAINDLKAGKIEYRADKSGNVHAPIGKASFSLDDLYDNFEGLMRAIVKSRPSGVKGRYLLNISVASTMGPGVKLDPNEILDLTT
ncbi:ribosomal protein L1 [Halobacteroides halobius DSM 5150]|uniref:Large ribosomal subunit protein uL1 n=1 Tax=Halobacteroides halobius (strain ATCC 35273 / DSM 5150 / MD-1) TaxID=748449 RepID=L0K598_HALHC|nr:50S ribosomal protein L1 [Halobacteroides halobius]AGB40191.1 ribosomal protein L1 [Halobacteroides halobius DSM 5150]